MYSVKLDEFVFPITPGKITQTMKSNNETVTLINEGEVSYRKSPSLREFNISNLLLPRYNYPFAKKKKVGTPEAYVEQFRAYQNAKKVIDFTITRKSPNGKTNTNYESKSYKVTVENIEVTEDASELGTDVSVSLTLKEYKTWGAERLKASPPKTAKTKKDDTLSSLAKKYFGDTSKWKTIYKLNKKTVKNSKKKLLKKLKTDKDRKKAKLLPGQKLKLKKTKTTTKNTKATKSATKTNKNTKNTKK